MTDPQPRVVDLRTHRPYVAPERVDMAEWLQREPYRPTLLDDFHDLISEIRAEPYSHAFVALVAIVLWTGLLIAPLWLGLLS